MATVTSSAVAISSFTGLKSCASSASRVSTASAKVAATPASRLAVKAYLKDVGAVVFTTASSAMLASNAVALEVLLGSDDGGLAFVPGSFEVAAGGAHTLFFSGNGRRSMGGLCSCCARAQHFRL
ncbi:plastocyanin, chloroplastic-like isoform X1 [Lycium barbarum]|uniref:plastocyanin, chloroplastic-like isoform X1 n=1 Tax=Lycium barbarum TaxID=112863 RepID=UPI00293F5BDA|nr:plastocyanin, chloroplastic-like isoform X1 [Lycium barbarum]